MQKSVQALADTQARVEKVRLRVLVLADSEEAGHVLRKTLRSLGHLAVQGSAMTEDPGSAVDCVFRRTWDVVIIRAAAAFLSDPVWARLLAVLSARRGRILMASDGRHFTLAASNTAVAGLKERDCQMLAIMLALENVHEPVAARHSHVRCRGARNSILAVHVPRRVSKD